jgi:hypothetical protein
VIRQFGDVWPHDGMRQNRARVARAAEQLPEHADSGAHCLARQFPPIGAKFLRPSRFHSLTLPGIIRRCSKAHGAKVRELVVRFVDVLPIRPSSHENACRRSFP